MKHHLSNVAKRKAGDIEGWEPWYFDSVLGGIIVKGGIPTIVTKGKTKGRKKWDTKNSLTVIVSDDDIKSEHLRYEAETGKCGYCFGDGKFVQSISIYDGTTYKECRHCKGTGLARVQ